MLLVSVVIRVMEEDFVVCSVESAVLKDRFLEVCKKAVLVANRNKRNKV